MEAFLTSESLSFSYKEKPVLRNISFTLFQQEIIGIIGRNGSGKSTLLNLLAAQLKPDSGVVKYRRTKDIATFSMREKAHHIAFLPQHNAIDVGLTVFDIVEMGRFPHLKWYETLSDIDISIIDTALHSTNLTDYKNRKLDTLSGGEQQRVFLARCLAQQSPLLLLDEPTTSLDIAHQLDFMEILLCLREDKKAIMLCIHDLELASRYCDRLLLLHESQILAEGKPEEVLTQANLQTAFNIGADIVPAPSGRGLLISAKKTT